MPLAVLEFHVMSTIICCVISDSFVCGCYACLCLCCKTPYVDLFLDCCIALLVSSVCTLCYWFASYGDVLLIRIPHADIGLAKADMEQAFGSILQLLLWGTVSSYDPAVIRLALQGIQHCAVAHVKSGGVCVYV